MPPYSAALDTEVLKLLSNPLQYHQVESISNCMESILQVLPIPNG